MIPKSGHRFSDKIMLQQRSGLRAVLPFDPGTPIVPRSGTGGNNFLAVQHQIH
jgi:hypothetical protein